MWLLPIKSYLGDGLSFPTRNFGGGDIPDYQGPKRFLMHKAVKEQIVSSNLPPCRTQCPPEPRAERVTAREPEQDSGQPDPRLGAGEGGLLQHRGQARPERRRQDRHGGRDRAHGPQRRADQRRILIIDRTILRYLPTYNYIFIIRLIY